MTGLSLFALTSIPTIAFVKRNHFLSKSISNLVSTESNLGRFNLSNQNEIRKYWLERDPENRFLEDVLGDQALDWVKGQNKICVDSVGNPENSPYYNRILNILDSKDKIPYVSKINNYYYNFWQDSSHKKGLLRRTTLESYLSSETVWEPVLSIDDLCAKESENWVYSIIRYCRKAVKIKRKLLFFWL